MTLKTRWEIQRAMSLKQTMERINKHDTGDSCLCTPIRIKKPKHTHRKLELKVRLSKECFLYAEEEVDSPFLLWNSFLHHYGPMERGSHCRKKKEKVKFVESRERLLLLYRCFLRFNERSI